MIIVMAVSLVTARYTLQILGVEDYGINNVVAGIIQFTGIITSTMIQATQRFLSFDLGRNDIKQFQKTFSMMMNIFIIICCIAFVLMELIGPYCITHYLTIPEQRMSVALWIFQFSIVTFMLDTINIPHTATIVAYEKMNVYAYVTLVDVIFKLLVVLSLFIIPFDKLIIYGLLNALACLVRNFIIQQYCKRKLAGCTYTFFWDGSFFQKLSSYIGWSMLGSTNSVMMSQGQTILLNLFFGPIVNAAKAIADKIKTMVYSFISNFYMAVTPQIIKTYANEDYDYTKKLVIRSSKLAFFLLLLLSVPIIINIDWLLYLWLGKESVDEDMIAFSRLVMVFSLVQVLECPITKAVQASAKIKKYEIVVGLITLSFIPICYVIFKCGMPATTSMVLLILIYSIAQIYRVLYVRHILNLTLKEYSIEVFFPIICTIIPITFLSYSLSLFNWNEDIVSKLLLIILNIILTAVSVWIIGINKSEKTAIVSYIRKKI